MAWQLGDTELAQTGISSTRQNGSFSKGFKANGIGRKATPQVEWSEKKSLFGDSALTC
jgi:hypothetical protein